MKKAAPKHDPDLRRGPGSGDSEGMCREQHTGVVEARDSFQPVNECCTAPERLRTSGPDRYRLSILECVRYSTLFSSPHRAALKTRRCRCEVTGCHQRHRRRAGSLASVAHDHYGLTRTPHTSESSRRLSPYRRSRVTWSLPPTWRPRQSDRQRTQKPAFTQFNHPMEPTSTPRWHHQSPTAYRLFCLLSAIPICSLFDEFVARAWQ